MAFQQATRALQVMTAFGADEIQLIGFEGEEELSRLGGFQLELVSENPALDSAKIVGQNISFSVTDDETRYFNGFVNRVLVQRNVCNRMLGLAWNEVAIKTVFSLFWGPAPKPSGFYALGLLASEVVAVTVATSPPSLANSIGAALRMLPSRALSSDRVSSV